MGVFLELISVTFPGSVAGKFTQEVIGQTLSELLAVRRGNACLYHRVDAKYYEEYEYNHYLLLGSTQLPPSSNFSRRMKQLLIL